MESKDYQDILDAMPKTGVYVIRQDDHSILYFNRHIAEIAPHAHLGMPCSQLWTSVCSCCPLLSINGKQESRSISYSEVLGGVVDLSAARITWAGSIPAFLVTVKPRADTVGYTYRKVLVVDLNQDRCTVLKSDAAGLLFQTSGESFSSQMVRFAESGVIHPGDVERFSSFARLSQLRAALRSGKDNLTCIYRRRNDDGSWSWNLLEIVPGFDSDEDCQTAFLCVKDVDQVLRDGLELEDISIRQREVVRTLAGQHFSVYTLDLDSGMAVPVRVDGMMEESRTSRKLPWEDVMIPRIKSRIHPAYHAALESSFSLAALRQSRDDSAQNTELLCQWLYGESYRYISITALFSQSCEAAGQVVISFQDVDERVRRELTHSQRDMQLAAILRSRFSMMNTIELESGLCERVSLDESAGLQNTHLGDYSYYIQQAIDSFIAPEDVFQYREILSLDHLREAAATIEDFHEEICQYRTRGEPVRWLEQHVLYVRRGDKVMVHILGRDITKERAHEEAHRQMLQDRSDIITSLNSLFFCMYYVDLNSNTFRTVTQLNRIGDVLGSEVDCMAAMRIYANNFIHPDDREPYLRIMCIDNWRDCLRWWHPSVEMEYRRLPESPNKECTWVRASAVLARTGPDDLPKTVVYVAQNIPDSRQR